MKKLKMRTEREVFPIITFVRRILHRSNNEKIPDGKRQEKRVKNHAIDADHLEFGRVW